MNPRSRFVSPPHEYTARTQHGNRGGSDCGVGVMLTDERSVFSHRESVKGSGLVQSSSRNDSIEKRKRGVWNAVQ
jgi:hypothetical protein